MCERSRFGSVYRRAIARHRPAAELADNRRLFQRAVEAKLHDWDTYVD